MTGYLIAVAATAAAVLARWLLDPWLGDRLTFVTLFGAVAVAVWAGGYRPALLAVALGHTACLYLFAEPRGSAWPAAAGQWLGSAAYLFSCGIIVGFGQSLHAARRRLADKRARLLASEEFHRTISDLTADYCWAAAVGPGGRVVTESVTEGFTKLLGYTLADVQKDGWDVVAHPDERDAARQAVGRLMRGETIRGEMRHVAKGGRVVWINYLTRPLLDGHGRVVRLVGAAQDITTRKLAEDEVARLSRQLADRVGELQALLAERERAEAAARAGDARRAFLLELSDTLRPLADPAEVEAAALRTLGRHLGASRAYYVEVEPDEQHVVCANDYTDGVPSAAGRYRLADYSPALLGEYRAGRTVVIADSAADPLVPGEARAAWAAIGVRAQVAVPLVKGGRFVAALGVDQDRPRDWTADEVALVEATAERTWASVERARAEERVRASEERFRGIFDQAVAGIAEADLTGRFVRVNRRYCEIVGRTPDELYALRMQDITHPDDLPRNLALLGPAVETGGSFDIEKRYVRPDGSTVWVGNSVAVVTDDRGRPAHLVAVAVDVTARRRAEESLAASEERFRSLMDQAPFSVQLLSADGRTARVNRAWEELWGLTLDQLAGYSLLDDPQLEARGVLPLIRQAFAGEPAFLPPVRYDPSEVVPLPDRPDPVRWVGAVAYPLKDAAGRVREVVLVHEDATARKRAEDALSASEARFRHLADAMPQIVWTAGPDGVVNYSNRRWHEFSGTAEGVGNDMWRSLLHPDDWPPAAARWAESVRAGEPFEMEIRLLDRRVGGYRWHLFRTAPERDETGGVARWYGTATDIDDTKRAGETHRFLADASAALAELTDYESTLQRVAALAVPYFADWCAADVREADGSVRRLAVSHTDPAKVALAHELFRRYPPGPSDPRGVMKVLNAGLPEWVPAISDEMLVAGSRDPDHLRIARELGLKSYVCVPLKSRGGVLGALTFVTAESGRAYGADDLRAAEDLAHRAAVAIENATLVEALRDADRRKDEFLATLAHELRNPLAPIRNGLQVMKLAGGDPRAGERSRAMMERQVGQMARLVDDLMDLSRISRGKIVLRKTRTPVAVAIRNAVDASRPLIDQQGHELTLDVPDEPIYVDADDTRLTQVFVNLLNNAAKYTDRGGRIRLSAERRGGGVVVSVEDTGVGIPAHMLTRVFDMFSQVDRSLERAQGGLGIGLHIVRGLVEMHGGTVEVHSGGHGAGSAFVVRLPVVLSVTTDRPEAETAEAATAARRRVLVVDDNRDGATSLAEMLTVMGNETQTAFDGLEAVAVAEAFRPDVILMDIGMPKLNGYDACRRIREQPWGRDVVIVAQTGWGQDDDRRKSEAAGFNFHLVKPVDPSALEELLARTAAAAG